MWRKFIRVQFITILFTVAVLSCTPFAQADTTDAQLRTEFEPPDCTIALSLGRMSHVLKTQEKSDTTSPRSLRRVPSVSQQEGKSPSFVEANRFEQGGSLTASAIKKETSSRKTQPAGILYREVLNKVEVFAPADAKSYRIESSTGKTVEGTKIRISPSSDSVVLQIYTGNQKLGTKRFDVVEPPQPQLNVYGPSGGRIPCGGKVPRARAMLQFEVEPDSTFAARHPEDATYRIGQAEVTIHSRMDTFNPVGTFKLNKDGWLKEKLIRASNQVDARPGDRLEIQLQEVVRINHEGEVVPVGLSETALRFQFVFSD